MQSSINSRNVVPEKYVDDLIYIYIYIYIYIEREREREREITEEVPERACC